MRTVVVALLCIVAAAAMFAVPARAEFAVTSPTANHLLVYSNLGPAIDWRLGLSTPLDVCFAPNKDIWFAESGNNRVVRLAYNAATQKWVEAETVSVTQPITVITDDAGTLYVACNDQKIWKYQGGTLTHWATTTHIDPKCMAWGPYGRLWVTCNDAHYIDIFDPSGGSPVLERSFGNPAGITSGPDYNLDGVPDMYVNNRSNDVHVLSGKDADSLGRTVNSAPELGQAIGMKFGADANADGTRDLYICDWNNGVTRIYSGRPPYNHIRLLNNDSAYFIGAYPPLPSKLISDGYVVGSRPFADQFICYNLGVNTLALGTMPSARGSVTLPDGGFWMASYDTGLVVRHSRTAENAWSPVTAFEVPSPTGVTMDSSGNVFVASQNGNIYRYDGTSVSVWGGPTALSPRDIAFGPGGRLWVACDDGQRLQVWDNGSLALEMSPPLYFYGVACGPDQTGDGVPDMYVAAQNDRVYVVDGLTGQFWDHWVLDSGRLSNALGIDLGPDQDFDGVPDLYVGQPGGQVGVHVYSGRTGAYIRYLNNDPLTFVSVYPAVSEYAGSNIPATNPDVKLVYSYNADEHGNWYLAPGVGFAEGSSFGWGIYDSDPKPWGGRILGSFNTTNTLSLTGLPPHSKVTVTYDLVLFGVSGEKWDGQGVPGDEARDTFRCYVQGADAAAAESFSQDAAVAQSYPYGAGGVTYPGLTGSSRQAVNTEVNHSWSEFRNMTFTVDHSGSSVVIVFEYGASQPGERYLIDNVRVAVSGQEPGLPPFTGSIGAVKGVEEGRTVIVEGKAVTAVFFEADASQSLYVEEEDRSSGIKVYPAASTLVTVGDRVKVTGKLQTDANGELSITQATVEVLSSGLPELLPLGMSNRALTSGQGLDPTGLLVRTWGRVKAVNAGEFFVDDGSGYSEGPGTEGLRVRGTSPASAGGYVRVTGIRARQKVGDSSVPVIRMRTDSDAASVE